MAATEDAFFADDPEDRWFDHCKPMSVKLCGSLERETWRLSSAMTGLSDEEIAGSLGLNRFEVRSIREGILERNPHLPEARLRLTRKQFVAVSLWLDGMTQEQIATHMGLGKRQRVGELIARARLIYPQIKRPKVTGAEGIAGNNRQIGIGGSIDSSASLEDGKRYSSMRGPYRD